MITEIGHFALHLAFFAALAQAVLPAIGLKKHHDGLLALAEPLCFACCFFLCVAFATLVRAYLLADFSLIVVARDTHSLLPNFYRIGAVWAAREGSLLLLVASVGIFSAFYALSATWPDRRYKIRTLSLTGGVVVLLTALSIYCANPFIRQALPVYEGVGLNAVLQNPAVIVHPLFYLSALGGLGLVYALALAALVETPTNTQWSIHARPWVLLSWSLLTLGIVFGCRWSFTEAGWGGWWAWDPVENAALVPWLLATALMHAIIVLAVRNALIHWTILLAIGSFSASLLGLFITRSGLFDSLHGYSAGPDYGIPYLVVFAIVALGGAALYGRCARKLVNNDRFDIISRESLVLTGNLVLVAMAGLVTLATVVPAFTSASAAPGAAFYNYSLAPFVPLLAALVVLAPLMRWQKDSMGQLVRDISIWLELSAFVFFVCLFVFYRTSPLLCALGFGFSVLILCSCLHYVGCRYFPLRADFSPHNRVISTFKRRKPGMVIAHAGFAIFLCGVTASACLNTVFETTLAPGQNTSVANHKVHLAATRQIEHHNSRALTVKVGIKGPVTAGKQYYFTPEIRHYMAPAQTTLETSIKAVNAGEIAVTVASPGKNGQLRIGVRHSPFSRLLWFGMLLMAIGGLVSLIERAHMRLAGYFNRSQDLQ